GIQLPGIPPEYGIAANAFLMALLCSSMLDQAAKRLQMAQHGIVLLGIALVFGFNALLALIQLLSDAAALQSLLYWMMGSLGGSGWPQVTLMAAVFVICASGAFHHAWQLTALRFGEERAGSFGMNTRR